MYKCTCAVKTYNFAGISVNLYAMKMLYSGENCYVEMKNIVISFLMYFSYFILFCNFFIKTYLKKNDKVKVSDMIYTIHYTVFSQK